MKTSPEKAAKLKLACKVIATNVLAILLILAALEAWYRVRTPPAVHVPWHAYDAEIGWVPAASIAIPPFDRNGRDNAVSTTNGFGFRAWGDVHSTKPRVLFIGDSFTGLPATANDDAYFSVVKKALDVEVFAAGAGGYSTLQELLLLRRYVSLINPTALVLQFGGFDGNSMELEDYSIVRTQKYFRPYWVDGHVIFRRAALYRWLTKWSYAFRALDTKLQNYQYRLYGGYTSPADAAVVAAARDKAEPLTVDLFKEMSASVPAGAKLATFLYTSSDPELEARWLRVASQANFAAWPDVAREVDARRKAGANDTLPNDVHWNALGNRIAGIQISKDLSRLLNVPLKPGYDEALGVPAQHVSQ